MGSLHSDTQGDLIGVELLVYDRNFRTAQRCHDTLDGSGFYHCGYYGRYLRFVKYEDEASFTICEVSIYSETNFMNLNPVASTN